MQVLYILQVDALLYVVIGNIQNQHKKDTVTRHNVEATLRQYTGEPIKEKTAFCGGLGGGCQEWRHDSRAGGP